MRCESFEDRLNEVLDARRPPSSASDLSEHIRQCAPCRALARTYEAMLLGLQQSELPPEPTGLASRVLGQLHRPNPSPADRSIPGHSTPLPRSRVLPFPRRRVLAVAVAAAIVAAMAWPMFFNRGVNVVTENQPGANHLTGREPTPHIAQTDQLPRGGKTSPAADQPQYPSADVPAVPRTPPATAFLDPSQLSLPAAVWAHDVADGLEPVTKPTVGAINGFLQLWGVGEEGRRS